MTGKRAGTLLELMRPIEYFTLARAWEDLTDDEFFWEPFTTTWSIRRQDQCSTPSPFGAGEWVADFEIPEPAPVPMTTIAWLYWHLGSMPGRLCDIDFLGGTRTMASGWTSPSPQFAPLTSTISPPSTLTSLSLNCLISFMKLLSLNFWPCSEANDSSNCPAVRLSSSGST